MIYSGDDMLGNRIPFNVFRQKLIAGDHVYKNHFYIEDNDKYDDCRIGFNDDYDKPYWFGLTPDGNNAYKFKTADEILSAKVFDGKSLKDLWSRVYFYSLNGMDPKDWVALCCIDYDLCSAQDAEKVAALAVKLWSDADYEELKNEFEALIQTDNNTIFTAYFQNQMIAFAHCSIRTEYVEGAEDGSVAYLEGIYVERDFRRLGIAERLICRCENWALSKGLHQLASDCEINNSTSIAMHMKSGFTESARIVHFIKNI